jgi:hypothetical protein
MIVVRVELHGAVSKRVTLLGAMVIANDGACEDARRGNYDVKVARKADAGDLRKLSRDPLRRGRVERYPRLSYNVWRLVLRALAAAFPEERVSLPDVDAMELEAAASAASAPGEGRGEG